ncbi:hypothetical protein QVD99_005560 [Batrachochytrium dendrobatidis]|nr:hypothetical protein QVD99_005560 [Batrachochytrium dendrobatidis]
MPVFVVSCQMSDQCQEHKPTALKNVHDQLVPTLANFKLLDLSSKTKQTQNMGLLTTLQALVYRHLPETWTTSTNVTLKHKSHLDSCDKVVPESSNPSNAATLLDTAVGRIPTWSWSTTKSLVPNGAIQKDGFSDTSHHSTGHHYGNDALPSINTPESESTSSLPNTMLESNHYEQDKISNQLDTGHQDHFQSNRNYQCPKTLSTHNPHQHYSSFQQHRESAWSSPFAFAYQLACGWFITVAVASTLISLPISAVSLPFFLFFGLSTAVIAIIISLIVRLWVRFLIDSLQAIRNLLFSPNSLLSYASDAFNRAFSKLMNFPQTFSPLSLTNVPAKNGVYQQQSLRSDEQSIYPSNRSRLNHSSSILSERASQCSLDDTLFQESYGKQIEPTFLAPDLLTRNLHTLSSNPNLVSIESNGSGYGESNTHNENKNYWDSAHGNQSEHSLIASDISKDHIHGRVDAKDLIDGFYDAKLNDKSESTPQFPVDRVRPLLGNITVRLLTEDDKDRIELCRLLYSVTTNVPVDDLFLTVGNTPDGNTHSILSIWNEDIPDDECTDQLSLYNLIGFADYFSRSHDDVALSISIDRLIISNTYTDMGFSKRLLRKLQYTPCIHTIHVWSLWHTVEFYKGLGFINVYEECLPEQPIELSHQHRLTRKRSKLRRVEGKWGPLLCWKKHDPTLNQPGLHSFNSMVSLAGGVGAKSD